MALKVSIGGTTYDVVSSQPVISAPCFDSDYSNLSWNFVTCHEFANFQAFNLFSTGLKSEYSPRIKTVIYAGNTESNMVLVSVAFNGNKINENTGKIYAEFSWEFVKENI